MYFTKNAGNEQSYKTNKTEEIKMKNLLNWNNFVAVSENSNGSYNLEFHVDGLLIVITGAELTESVTVDGVPQHPLKYWHQEENIKRAIEWAEPEDIEVVGELDELNAEEDVEGILDEIADITADLANSSTDLVERLDKVAFTLQNQGKTAYKGATSVSEPKSEVVLTARQLAALGRLAINNKNLLKFQNHALNLVKSPREVKPQDAFAYYSELFRLTEDIFDANQGIIDDLEKTGWLLQESENKDEISAFYNNQGKEA